MDLELISRIDVTIRDALHCIERQREFIEKFSARGYDMRPALSLLSSLLLNLKRLERQRRDVATAVQDVLAI